MLSSLESALERVHTIVDMAHAKAARRKSKADPNLGRETADELADIVEREFRAVAHEIKVLNDVKLTSPKMKPKKVRAGSTVEVVERRGKKFYYKEGVVECVVPSSPRGVVVVKLDSGAIGKVTRFI